MDVWETFSKPHAEFLRKRPHPVSILFPFFAGNPARFAKTCNEWRGHRAGTQAALLTSARRQRGDTHPGPNKQSPDTRRTV